MENIKRDVEFGSKVGVVVVVGVDWVVSAGSSVLQIGPDMVDLFSYDLFVGERDDRRRGDRVWVRSSECFR